MSKNLNITGRDQVLRNMQAALDKVRYGTEKGLVRAGMFIRGEATRRAPIDTGNLRNSAYVVSNSGTLHSGTPRFSNARKDAGKQSVNFASAISEARARVAGKQPCVEIGFATTYAAAVHEHTNVAHVTGEAKYLENAVKSNTSKIVDFVVQEARII